MQTAYNNVQLESCEMGTDDDTTTTNLLICSDLPAPLSMNVRAICCVRASTVQVV